MNRRVLLLPLGLLLLGQNACASRGAGWEVGMMGAMVVGGLVLGRGLMHGGSARRSEPSFVEQFQPARLLEQRVLLELTEEQAGAIESLRADVEAGRRTREEAASAAYDVLRPVQRAAVMPSAPPANPHH